MFIFSVHIPLLKELEIRDIATAWTHISAEKQGVLKKIQIKSRKVRTGHQLFSQRDGKKCIKREEEKGSLGSGLQVGGFIESELQDTGEGIL